MGQSYTIWDNSLFFLCYRVGSSLPVRMQDVHGFALSDQCCFNGCFPWNYGLTHFNLSGDPHFSLIRREPSVIIINLVRIVWGRSDRSPSESGIIMRKRPLSTPGKVCDLSSVFWDKLLVFMLKSKDVFRNNR